MRPEKFEDRYESALRELLEKKQAGVKITPREPAPATNVVNLMDALRRSIEAESDATKPKPAPSRGRKEAANPSAHVERVKTRGQLESSGRTACSSKLGTRASSDATFAAFVGLSLLIYWHIAAYHAHCHNMFRTPPADGRCFATLIANIRLVWMARIRFLRPNEPARVVHAVGW